MFNSNIYSYKEIGFLLEVFRVMHRWKGLNIEAEGCGISKPLSKQVNLLGTLLGHVIREQAGDAIFSIVEQLSTPSSPILCSAGWSSNESF